MGVIIEPTDSNPKYKFNSFQEGIADSPELGFSDMRNVEIGSFPGELIPNYKTVLQVQTSIQASTFTVDPATNIFTNSSGIPLLQNAPITVANTGGGLPAGVSANTIYYVIYLSDTTFSLALKPTGSAIDITTAGTGTNKFSTFDMGVPKNALYIKYS